jgi:sugar phosphate isomerase/epimerase
MRICAGGRASRPAGWDAHRRALLPLLEEAADYGRSLGLVLAVENHADLLAHELAELITTVDSPWLGVCLDTANNLRMLEDPDRAIDTLAPFAKAVHLKDVAAHRGDPKTFTFWPSVPLGRGVIDIPRTLRVLHDHGFDGLLAIEIDYLHPDHRGDGPVFEDPALAESIAYTRDSLAAL